MLSLNLGSGPCTPPGWLHCDRQALPGVGLVFDLRSGVPLRSASVDRIGCIHVLQDLNWLDLRAVAAELFRVLAEGGVARIAVPDLDRAIAAYLRGDRGYFYVPDGDARSLGAKPVPQAVWYGSVQTPMTFGFLEEWLHDAGVAAIAAGALRREPLRRAGVARQSRAREPLPRGDEAFGVSPRS